MVLIWCIGLMMEKQCETSTYLTYNPNVYNFQTTRVQRDQEPPSDAARFERKRRLEQSTGDLLDGQHARRLSHGDCGWVQEAQSATYSA